MIFLIVVRNGYVLVTLIGTQAENHDFCFALINKFVFRYMRYPPLLTCLTVRNYIHLYFFIFPNKLESITHKSNSLIMSRQRGRRSKWGEPLAARRGTHNGTKDAMKKPARTKNGRMSYAANPS